MADRNAPQGLPRLVSLCQERQLAVRDSHGLAADGGNRGAAAVHIKLGQSSSDGENLYHGTVLRRNPKVFACVVVPGRNGAAHRESQEILHIVIERLAEVDHLGTHGQRLIHRVANGVSVCGVRRQRRGHAAGPVSPTVYSVARTLSVLSGTLVPLGRSIVACVPGASELRPAVFRRCR